MTTWYLNSPRGTREDIYHWAAAVGAEIVTCILCLDGNWQAMGKITREVAQDLLNERQHHGPLPSLWDGSDASHDVGGGGGPVCMHGERSISQGRRSLAVLAAQCSPPSRG